jgi:hypothetical protein
MTGFALGHGFGDRCRSPEPRPVALPADFLARWTPDFQIWRVARSYFTKLDYAALKPAIAKTYYVKSTGSDAAAGTAGAPLLSLSTALAKSDVDEVVIDCSGGDYVMRGARGWNNTQPSRDVSVRVIGPGRAISVATVSSSLPTWMNTAGAVYKTTIAAGSARSVIDLANREADGFYQRLAEVGSTGAVASTPGSWFHDGADLHVQAYDGRNLVGDALLLPCGTSNNCRVPSANRTIHIDGVDFVGGVPLNFTAAGAVDPLLVALNCSFQGSHNQNANNVTILGPGRFYFYRCGSGRAHRDGFNYHGNGFGDPKFFENKCWTGLSGYVGSSDNASTSHENAVGLRVDGDYGGSLNRTVADINGTIVGIFGSLIRQPRINASGMECLAQQHDNKTWLDGVRFEDGTNAQLVITGNANVAYRNMPSPHRASTGEDTGVLSAW